MSSASAHGQPTVNPKPYTQNPKPPHFVCETMLCWLYTAYTTLVRQSVLPVKLEGARHQKDRVYYPRAVTKLITFISARRVLVAATPRPRPPALLR